MKKILTISIAAYNVENTIKQALDSLAIESIIDDIEVFIVDDGGKDGTLGIAKQYEDKYPGTFHAVHKENGGYGSVINTSVSMATGQYFKQLDGDDWFDRESLPEFIELLKKIDVDYVFSSIIINNESDGTKEEKDFTDYLKEGIYNFESVKFERFVSMHSTTIRTELLKDIDLHVTEHSFYTDLELVYKPLSAARSFYVWHHPVYHYRIGVEGQSGSVIGIKKHAGEHIARANDLIDLYAGMEKGSRKDLLGLRVVKQVNNQCRVFSILGIKEWKKLRKFCNEFRDKCPELVARARSIYRRLDLLFATNYLAFPALVVFDRIKKDNKPV